MPEVSVIVPARDAAGTLRRTLDCLGAQSFGGEYEVIVVDDGSADGSAELAEAHRAATKVIRQGALGPAEARNRGVVSASGHLLAFCDADCFPAPRWLEAGARALQDADLVQGQVMPDPDSQLGPFDRSLWIPFEVGLYECANLFVTREVFERCGGFEEWLKPVVGKALAEDIWFGWRARRAGARSAFSAEALAYHAVFERGPADYVAERRRLRHFPEIARKVPELREGFFYRRWFLNQRSAAFDALVVGLGAAVLTRRWLFVVAAAPYLRLASRRTREWGPKVGAVDVAADAVGALELVRGSAQARSMLL